MDEDRGDRKDQRKEDRIRRRGRRSPLGSIVIGALVVIVGVFLLLDNMGIVQVEHIWRFWPLFLIGLGLSKVLSSSEWLAKVWGGVVAGVGLLLILENFGLFHINFNLVWPLVVIGFGLSMLWRGVGRPRGGDACGVSTNPDVNLVGIFSGGRRRIDSKEFRGCDVFTFCGGFEIDLRNATLANGKAVIDINAVFGGVEIRVPETWSVLMKGVGIFGGFENKTAPPRVGDTAPGPELIVTGAAIFGGASVRN